MENLYAKELINVNLKAKNKTEAIDELALMLFKNQRLIDLDAYVYDVKTREAEYTTYIGNGVGMPHAISNYVSQASVAIGISKEGIDYDGEIAYIIILIAMPQHCSYQHIKVLGDINSIFLDEHNLDLARNANKASTILKLFAEDAITDDEEFDMNRVRPLIIACTSCVSGVAHTYLAAKSLKIEAERADADIIVETSGAMGLDNSPTEHDISRATCIIIASDNAVDMKRFDGKRIIFSNVKEGVNNASGLIKRALAGEGEIYDNHQTNVKNIGKKLYSALLNGISYMIPFVAIGGIMMAIAYSFGGEIVDGGLVVKEGTFYADLLAIGNIGMKLMLPILSGYIAYSIGDRSALAPGVIGGYICSDGSFYNSEFNAGFFGAILAGYMAGYLVYFIKKIKLSLSLSAIMPMIVIPIVATSIIGFVFINFVGYPISIISNNLYEMLESLNQSSLLLLGIIMGFMQGFDLGGPFGKTVLMFSIACIAEGNLRIMGAQAMAIPVAPLGAWLATFLERKSGLFSEYAKSNGLSSLFMGFCGISEGAIPFASADPLSFIPASMIGSAVATTLALMFKMEVGIAWGGPVDIIMGLTNNPLAGAFCIIVGAFTTASIYISLKKYHVKRAKKVTK